VREKKNQPFSVDVVGNDPGIDPEILARAEQAVAALGADFIKTARRDVAEMQALIARIGDAPGEFAGDASRNFRRIFEIAHDLRGQGGSFGYPLVSRAAGAMCDFYEARDHRPADSDIEVLRSHAEAMARVVASDVKGEGDAELQALLDSLEAGAGPQVSGRTPGDS